MILFRIIRAVEPIECYFVFGHIIAYSGVSGFGCLTRYVLMGWDVTGLLRTKLMTAPAVRVAGAIDLCTDPDASDLTPITLRFDADTVFDYRVFVSRICSHSYLNLPTAT